LYCSAAGMAFGMPHTLVRSFIERTSSAAKNLTLSYINKEDAPTDLLINIV
jgi:hypothetical protein